MVHLDERCRLSSMPCSGARRGRGDGSKVGELVGGSRAAAGPGSRSSSCAESSEALLSMRGALSLLELPARPNEAERRIRPSMPPMCGCGEFGYPSDSESSALLAPHAICAGNTERNM